MGGANKRGYRGDGERERVCSHSEGKKRYKGREGKLREAGAELNAGKEADFGKCCQATWTGGRQHSNCVLVNGKEGG